MSKRFKVVQSRWRRQPYRYHPVFGWWHVPNIRAHLPLGETFHLLRTNSDGLRADQDYPKASPTGRKRLVLLGDSYSAGDGVSNGERFSDRLEQRYANLDVINFGLNGSGTDQQLLIYENLAKSFEHDAIIWAICVENIARNLCTCRPSFDFSEHKIVYRPKPYFVLEGGNLQLRNEPILLERRAPDALGDWICNFPYLPEHPEDPFAIYRYPDRPHWQLMRALLLRVAKDAGRPLVLMPLPMNSHYLEQIPQSYMPAFQALHDPGHGVHVIDILPAFIKRPLSERRTFEFPGDPHYTAAAHQQVAEELDRRLGEVLGPNWASP